MKGPYLLVLAIVLAGFVVGVPLWGAFIYYGYHLAERFINTL